MVAHAHGRARSSGANQRFGCRAKPMVAVPPGVPPATAPPCNHIDCDDPNKPHPQRFFLEGVGRASAGFPLLSVVCVHLALVLLGDIGCWEVLGALGWGRVEDLAEHPHVCTAAGKARDCHGFAGMKGKNGWRACQVPRSM